MSKKNKKNRKNNNKKNQQEKTIQSKPIKKGNLNLKLPKDTKEAIIQISQIENYYLKLNKFALMKDGEYKITHDENNVKPGNNNISKWVKCAKKLEQNRTAIKKTLEKGNNVREIKMEQKSKMIVGLGGHSIYETSITLHHIYGIPYIPGSALKGSIRSYIINEFFSQYREGDKDKLKQKLNDYNYNEGKKKDNQIHIKFDPKKDMAEELAMADPIFIRIFGNQEKAGRVTFFDAYPDHESLMNIETDIMNCHYTDYYSGKNIQQQPLDTESPNIVNFLVLENTSFNFMIAVKKKYNDISNIKSDIDKKKCNQLCDLVKKYLIETLTDQGIGAKTAVGYGYFKDDVKNN
jgi:CRISPR-associated protein Cmr6